MFTCESIAHHAHVTCCIYTFILKGLVNGNFDGSIYQPVEQKKSTVDRVTITQDLTVVNGLSQCYAMKTWHLTIKIRQNMLQLYQSHLVANCELIYRALLYTLT